MIGIGTSEPPGERHGTTRNMRASERECWIALSMIPGVGPAGFAHLVRRHGSAAAAWRAGPEGLEGVARLSAGVWESFAEFARGDPRELARTLIDATERAGGRVLTGLEDDYPPALWDA